MNSLITKKLTNFQSISLAEMDSVMLMKRTDTKFVMPYNDLPLLLDKLKQDYKILEINGDRLMDYSSLYFDTIDYKFYNDHHNGKTKRTKIRIRNYVNSNLYFLEIKQKNGQGITIKKRLAIDGFEHNLSENSNSFIKNTTGIKYQLQHVIQNSFQRITLVNIENKERVTIDINLSFNKDNETYSFDNLVVVELKQAKFNRKSKVVQSLRQLGYLPNRISKYCIGILELTHGLKHNAFKQKLRIINKITAA